jgi:hypothetical protein
VCDLAEGILALPDAALGCLAGSIHRCTAPAQPVLWRKDEPAPLSERFLEVSPGGREGTLLGSLTRTLVAREARFFASLESSELYTPGFEAGTEELDERLLRDRQRRILWDALRTTYLGRYRERAEDTLRDESLEVYAWKGPDFVVLPPLVAGYVYFRGLEKDFSFAGTRLSVAFEPVHEWLGERDVWGAMNAEWKVKGCPVGLVVSVGLHDGGLGLDFVGIGTSLSIARKAVALQREGR